MSPSSWKYVLAAGLVGGISLAIAWQRWTLQELRTRADHLRTQADKGAAVRAEHARLVAQQPSAEERHELQQAAGELGQLRAKQTIPLPETRRAVPLQETTKPVSETWSNAGQATPDATFRTVLWAAKQSDVDTLAKTIAFDDKGRALVDALFARLPEDMRAKSGSPEKVFATLLASRLPQDVNAATLLAQHAPNANAMTLRLRLQSNTRPEKDVNFNFARSAEGWRLIVPAAVVENYQAMLKGAERSGPPLEPR